MAFEDVACQKGPGRSCVGCGASCGIDSPNVIVRIATKILLPDIPSAANEITVGEWTITHRSLRKRSVIVWRGNDLVVCRKVKIEINRVVGDLAKAGA